MGLPHKSARSKIFWISAALLVITFYVLAAIQGGGIIGGYTSSVSDFSLCDSDKSVAGSPRKLTTAVISPTSVVYACGYLEIDKPVAGLNTCLLFNLWRNNALLVRYPDAYCTQDGSGYFSYAIKTDELQVPAAYKLEVFDWGLRTWITSTTFEVR